MRQGTNELIRIAVIGINNQGEDHIQAVMKTQGALLEAVVDFDSILLQNRLGKETFRPIRKLSPNGRKRSLMKISMLSQ